MKTFYFLGLLFGGIFFVLNAQETRLPDTGISGVYEVMLGTDDGDYAKRYFADFGFKVVDSARFSASKALKLYGVNSALRSYRLQNGETDSHGLLRILVWEQLLGPGIGYMPPETIGSRMAVMRTENIYRLYDIYHTARIEGKKPWLPTEPIADDLYGLDTGTRDFFNRPVLVRENAVYGEFFNHVFFQRYGYHIPGYGTVARNTKLRTSEFTHHDFMIKVSSMEVLSYLSTALGLKAENAPEIDGDWLKGPKRVFQMQSGDSHWYQGFVSPNNICGKLKFFMPNGLKPDKSEHQRIGEKGITLHSFYTPKLNYVHELVR
ncbi:MAG: hypothetical protein AAF934_07405, partial [Bacteroidota bacterium]